MSSRIVLAGAFALAAMLPGTSNAQSDTEVRYPDGLIISPLPVVPSMSPSGNIIGATGSIVPRVIEAPPPAMMVVPPDNVAAAARRGCETQSYDVGPGKRVQVHRCY
ncbi:hypothetical protein [Microvirga massiliensis]|uniref:hypothetical protein n=1 Tax=Microvirga massiliensis TaxID=1033741 RepID=UPI00062B7452|nr:hypothetical protein [Microvirga massiliensis]